LDYLKNKAKYGDMALESGQKIDPATGVRNVPRTFVEKFISRRISVSSYVI